jgi:hypothetical protein
MLEEDREQQELSLETPEVQPIQRRGIRCSFCHEVGHTIRRCQCPERLLMETRIREYTSNTEGPLFCWSSGDIEFRLFDEIHGYAYSQPADLPLDANDMQRLVSISMKKRVQMLCMILRIPQDRTINRTIHRIVNEVIRIRNEILANETEETRLLRMDAYRRQIISTLLMNGRAELAIIDYNDILHLHGKYKRYKNILAQVGGNSEPEIQNMFIYTNISVMNLKEQIHSAILQYRMVYGDHENFRLILKDIDGEFITIVKELVEEGEEWEAVECPICYDTVDSSSVCMTNCFHKFCFACLSKTLNTSKEQKCPCCRTQITQIVNKSHVVLNDEIPDSIILK